MSFLIAIIITVLGLAYILSPIDLLPDFIPVIGWTDDFLVLMVILGAWVIAFGILAVQALFSIFKILIIIVILVIILKLLLGKTSKKRKK